MHPLTVNVVYATGLRREIAKTAICLVLLTLRDRLPEGQIVDFVDKAPQVCNAVRAHGGADLGKELASLGLDASQKIGLLNEVVARAEQFLGDADAEKIRQVLAPLFEY